TICSHRKIRRVARLSSHISFVHSRSLLVEAKSRSMGPLEQVGAKPRSREATEQGKVKIPVVTLPVSSALQVANPHPLNRIRVRLDLLHRVCSGQNGFLSFHNSPQRKTRCWRAGRAAADSRSGRACRQETHLLAATVLR